MITLDAANAGEALHLERLASGYVRISAVTADHTEGILLDPRTVLAVAAVLRELGTRAGQ